MHIICNWKAHGSIESIEYFASQIEATPGFEKIILCPPFPYIPCLKGITKGAQDVSFYQPGSYTGEVTASMLKDIGVQYVLIGHSERRRYHQEIDEVIVQKAQHVIDQGMTAIICVGEQNPDSSIDIKKLIKPYEHLKKVWIAYEPEWAIGTQHTPTVSHIDHVVSTIKSEMGTVVLYGGSVNDTNIDTLMNAHTIDGFLIGKASLDPIMIKKILKKVHA